MTSNKIKIRILPSVEKFSPGASKFFGNPHLPKDFTWPEYTDSDGENYYMDFICQINCRDIAPFDKDGLFPKEGILYFFYPLEDTPFTLHGSDAVCYYYNGDLSHTDELCLIFDDGTDFSTKEQKLELYVDDREEYPDHHLLGEPSMYPFDGDAVGLEDMILLFELYSFKTEDRNVCFWDDGTLQFYVSPEKLKTGDVSHVQVRLNTT